MPSYQLTNKATQDLEDIWNYTIDEWSENQADKYYFSLINSFTTLVNNPQICKNYNQIKSNLLRYLHNQHIIFYTILPIMI
jgi:toxin ParE1/3/4